MRRDHDTPLAWFFGKKILVLGCGALGSWAAEMLARSNPKLIHLVDNAPVKPGVLSRQNFRLDDIGANKAKALADRLKSIAFGLSVEGFSVEAYQFLNEKREDINNYDVVLDCTASAVFQMKLEGDWNNLPSNKPPIVSLIIDARAQHAVCVVLKPNSPTGVWDGYVRFKQELCSKQKNREVVKAFYSERATEAMFQPEPGCSEPTFVGSIADVSTLVANALNLAAVKINGNGEAVGFALTSPKTESKPGVITIKLPLFDEPTATDYRIRISTTVFDESRRWVKENNRVRSSAHETGGLLWGLWDDAIGVIWIFDASGPPPDSQHDPGHFICGVDGTIEEHKIRTTSSHGTCGFIGFWHTHPDMPSQQSLTDIHGMANLVSSIGQNQRRSLMLIFGKTRGKSTAGVYVYERRNVGRLTDLISVGSSQFALKKPVV